MVGVSKAERLQKNLKFFLFSGKQSTASAVSEHPPVQWLNFSPTDSTRIQTQAGLLSSLIHGAILQ